MRGLAILLVLMLALLAWLQYRLWFGNGGEREVAALQAQVQQQARDNAGLKQRNASLAAEVQDLKSGEAAVEERARSELGMIRPGEVFYRVVETQPAASANGASTTDASSADASSADASSADASSADASNAASGQDRNP